MTKVESKGYTLWLQPDGEVYKRFAELILKLAKSYNGPIFQPHVTLLGGIEQQEEQVLERTRQLSVGKNPFTVTLEDINYENYYFRTLFVRAALTEPLRELNDQARKLFNMEIPPYMPHLSLLYGTYPRDLKEKIVNEIGKKQSAEFTAGGIHIIKSTGDESTWHEVGFIPF